MPDYIDKGRQLSAIMDKIKTDTDVKAAREKAADEAAIETARQLAELQAMIAKSDHAAELRAEAQAKTDKANHHWQVAAVFIGIATLLATVLFGIKAWIG